MHVVFALLLSPLIFLSSYIWIPSYYLREFSRCDDRTLVSVKELRRADALTCDVDLAGLVNGAPFAATYQDRPCGEFGACLMPLLQHALELRDRQQQQQQQPAQQASSLAGGCGRMYVYHNHWDAGRCSQVVAPSTAPEHGGSPRVEPRWVATWADTEAMWWWLWKGLGFAWCLIALLVNHIVRQPAEHKREQPRRRRAGLKVN